MWQIPSAEEGKVSAVWEITCAAVLWLPNPYRRAGPRGQEQHGVANRC